MNLDFDKVHFHKAVIHLVTPLLNIIFPKTIRCWKSAKMCEQLTRGKWISGGFAILKWIFNDFAMPRFYDTLVCHSSSKILSLRYRNLEDKERNAPFKKW